MFGYFIDIYMHIFWYILPEYYIYKILLIIIGCFFIGVGAYFEIIANVSMLPGDAFIVVMSVVTKIEFGRLRVISDISMSLLAICIELISKGEISGVREGTIIAALITGNIVKSIMKLTKVS